MGSARPKNPHGVRSPYNANTTPPKKPRTDHGGTGSVGPKNNGGMGSARPKNPRGVRSPYNANTTLPKKPRTDRASPSVSKNLQNIP